MGFAVTVQAFIFTLYYTPYCLILKRVLDLQDRI